MPTCQKCGSPLGPDAKFCRSCGTPVSEDPTTPCPQCGRPVAAGAKFCKSCGAPQGQAAHGTAEVPEPAPEERRAEPPVPAQAPKPPVSTGPQDDGGRLPPPPRKPMGRLPIIIVGVVVLLAVALGAFFLLNNDDKSAETQNATNATTNENATAVQNNATAVQNNATANATGDAAGSVNATSAPEKPKPVPVPDTVHGKKPGKTKHDRVPDRKDTTESSAARKPEPSRTPQEQKIFDDRERLWNELHGKK